MSQQRTYSILLLLCLSYYSVFACSTCEPVSFIQNKGQWHEAVEFRGHIPAGTVFIEESGITYSLYDRDFYASLDPHMRFPLGHPGSESINCHALKMHFVGGGSQSFDISNPITEYFNYFIGQDKSKWASKARAFHNLLQQEVYPGIDVLWHSAEGQLKYDFQLEPKADPTQIKLAFEGQEEIEIRNGQLVLSTSIGEMVEMAPLAYQIIDGRYQKVECNYVLTGNEVQFDFPNGYDAAHPLVIDPTVVFSTYSGSLADNFGYTATFDSKGNLYGGGSAFGRPGQQYPTTLGAYQTVYGGGGVDMGITKYSADGSTRVYSTYLGGSDTELPHSFIVNGRDELFVFGTTSSTDFPMGPSAYDNTFNGGTLLNLTNGLGVTYNNGSDMVIARFSADGSNLLASTYLGGSENDGLNIGSVLRYNYADQVRGEIFIDEDDNVYIASCSLSPDLPVDSNAVQSVFGGNQDGCLFKLDDNLTTVYWGTYIGGTEHDAAYSLVLDAQQNPYVVGGTRSPDLFTTPNAYMPNQPGGIADGFIYHIDKNGQLLLEATYYGFANAYDQIYFVEKDNDGHVYVLGQTDAPDSSYILNAAYSTPDAGQFISQFSSDLDSLRLSVAFGRGDGSPDISPTAFLVDLCNKIYVAGWGGTLNSGPPTGLGRSANSTTNGLDITPSTAYQTTTDGSDFYLMVLEDDASILVYATYYGGNQSGDHVDGGTSRFDRNGIVYQSVCASCGPATNDFPIVPGPGQVVSGTDQSNGGIGDRCNNAVFKFDLELPLALANFDLPPSACVPLPITFNNTSELVDSPRAIYWWDFGDGTTSTQKNPTHAYQATGVYEITLAIFDSSSCNLTDTVRKQLVILSNTTDSLPAQFVCPNTNQQIGLDPTNDTTITFLWNPTTGLNLSNIPNPIVNISSSQTYELYVSNGLCTDTFIQPIIVDQANLRIAGDTVNCGGDTITLQAQVGGTTGSQFVWGPSAYLLSGQGTPSAEFLLPGDTVVTLRFTNDNGCTFIARKRVLNFEFPLITAALDPSICIGDTTQIFVGNGFPQYPLNYSWQPDSLIITDPFSEDPLVNPERSTMFYVTGDNGFGCEFLDSVLVSVLGGRHSTLPPIIQCDTGGVVIGPALTDSTLFVLDTTLDFSWSPTGGLSDPNIVHPIASVSGNTDYTLVVSNGNCADTFDQSILFDANVVFLEADGPYCLNDTATVNLGFVTPVPSYTVNWVPRPPVIGNPPGATATVSMTDTVTVTAQVTLSNGCVYNPSIFLDLFEPSTVRVRAFADEDSVDAGTAVQLNGRSPTAVIWSWEPVGIIDSPNIQNPVARPTQTTIFRLTATDTNGCTGEDTTIVYTNPSLCEEPYIFVPNAFSPNGDGDNDLLFVRGNNLTDIYFAVYDRWGQLMFETTDQSVGWDGTFDGAELDPAVFAWYLEGLCDDGFEIFLKGDVTLLR
jgi:gliding motility-associated-like protein